MNNKKKIGVILIAIICIVIAVGLIVDNATEIKIDDSRIESIIRLQADKQKGKLRKSDLDKVVTINSITGQDEEKYIYLFKNLEELTIKGTLEDNNIDFLENNKKLKKLYIVPSDGSVKNIDGLKNLENLEELSLINIDVEDIDALSNLGNLKKLVIVASSIKNWSGINKSTNLEELEIGISNLDDTGIKEAISNLKKVRV